MVITCVLIVCVYSRLFFSNMYLLESQIPNPTSKRTYNIVSFFKVFENPKNKSTIYDASSWMFQRTMPRDTIFIFRQFKYYPNNVKLCVEFMNEMLNQDDEEDEKQDDEDDEEHDVIGDLFSSMGALYVSNEEDNLGNLFGALCVSNEPLSAIQCASNEHDDLGNLFGALRMSNEQDDLGNMFGALRMSND